MASPLIGIAGVNSLLFASYGASRRIISPFPQLSLKETALAGAMAGAANAILASPGIHLLLVKNYRAFLTLVFWNSSGDVQGAHARTVWCQHG